MVIEGRKSVSKSKMSFKGFVDQSPLLVLVTVAISTATTVGGVAAYFATQSLDTAKAKYENQVSDLNIRAKNQLFETRAIEKDNI